MAGAKTENSRNFDDELLNSPRIGDRGPFYEKRS